MSATAIEWTDRTWNPVTGCTKVSPGCDHCYAEGIARRFAGTKAFPNGFEVTLHPERLDTPLRWRKPARVFVNSMSDLFHDQVSDQFIAHVWAVMALTPQHTYQVLTKRHGRLRSLLSDPLMHERVAELVAAENGEVYRRELVGWPLPNVWVGVSVEDQKRADLRIPALIDTPAAVRFLSCEPLLGPVDLTRITYQGAVREPMALDVLRRQFGHVGHEAPTTPFTYGLAGLGGIDWVIAGGESGPGARPMHIDWARELRDQCAAAGVAFHFKQHGEWLATDRNDPRYTGPVKGGYVHHHDGSWASFTVPGVPQAPAWVLRLGKKAAGRELDGRTHDDFPATPTERHP